MGKPHHTTPYRLGYKNTQTVIMSNLINGQVLHQKQKIKRAKNNTPRLVRVKIVEIVYFRPERKRNSHTRSGTVRPRFTTSYKLHFMLDRDVMKTAKNKKNVKIPDLASFLTFSSTLKSSSLLAR